MTISCYLIIYIKNIEVLLVNLFLLFINFYTNKYEIIFILHYLKLDMQWIQ